MFIQHLINRRLFAPEGEQGSATPSGEGSPPPGSDAGGQGGGESGSPPPGGEGTGGATEQAPSPRSSIMDFAPKGEAKPTDGDAWKMPEGLEIPEHLQGSSAEDTLRKLSTAYKGARQELSTRKREDGVLEGSVPKDIDGYQIAGDNPDDPIVKDLMSEESKPIVDAWRKAALELGVPDATFSKFMQMGIKNMQAEGLQITGDPQEAARINGEAEMEALQQAVGKEGADQMLRQIDKFAQDMANRGVLQSQDDVQEFAQMVGTSRALQIMNRIIVAEMGEKPIPRADGVEGAPTLQEAYEMQNAALSMPPGADREEAVARAEKALAKAMQEGSTPGMVRSRVL